MPQLKNLLLIPLLFLSTFGLIYFFKPALNEYIDIFFKPNFGIFEFGTISVFICLTSAIFVIIVTLTQRLLVSLISGLLSALISFMLLDFNLAIITCLALLTSFILAYFNLKLSLTSYINFQPSSILSGPFKMLCTLVLVSLSFAYYLNANSIIKTQGFQIPKPLVEWAVDLTLQMQGMSVKGEKYYLAQVTPEQLELLKQNPGVLEQFGVSARDLEELTTNTPGSPNQQAVKVIPSLPSANLKDILMAQTGNILESAIKPYHNLIPFLLAFMFFSIVSLLNWLLSFIFIPLISLVFLLLEKSGFIKFTTEMRQVKKIEV